MSELKIKIGLEIKAAREAKGLIQKDLAASAGVSRVLVYRLENGDYKNPSLETLEKIAGALGLELDFTLKPVKK